METVKDSKHAREFFLTIRLRGSLLGLPTSFLAGGEIV